MRKFLFSILLLLFGLLVLLFLVANRQAVFISLDPIDVDHPALALGPMPLWAALMAMMLVGYMLGGIGMWISGRGTRRKASERKIRIRELEHELALATRQDPAEAQAQPRVQPVPAIERQ